jgi:Flp pilus assembly protein TadB
LRREREIAADEMRLLFRLAYVLRKGSGRRRVQAWAGLILVAGAAVFIMFWLWRLLVVLAVFTAGVYLLRRALRQPSSSS